MKKRTKKPLPLTTQFAREHGSKAVNGLLELTAMIIAALLLLAIVWGLCLPVMPAGTFINRVEGSSMVPTLQPGQRVFADSAAPERLDIVVCRMPEGSEAESGLGKNAAVIKRVIGMPGDTVSITAEGVYVNGTKLQEKYLSADAAVATFRPQGNHNSVTLEADEYYIMGDNRGASYDSRYFGPVKAEMVLAVQSTKPTSVTAWKGIYLLAAIAVGALIAWYLSDRALDGLYWLTYRKKMAQRWLEDQ